MEIYGSSPRQTEQLQRQMNTGRTNIQGIVNETDRKYEMFLSYRESSSVGVGAKSLGWPVMERCLVKFFPGDACDIAAAGWPGTDPGR
jgi:hypothetical protein